MGVAWNIQFTWEGEKQPLTSGIWPGTHSWDLVLHWLPNDTQSRAKPRFLELAPKITQRSPNPIINLSTPSYWDAPLCPKVCVFLAAMRNKPKLLKLYWCSKWSLTGGQWHATTQTSQIFQMPAWMALHFLWGQDVKYRMKYEHPPPAPLWHIIPIIYVRSQALKVD